MYYCPPALHPVLTVHCAVEHYYILANLSRWQATKRNALRVRRSISVDMFQKAMDLDLRWHLMRKTGEVTRVMDRGTSAIQQVLSTGDYHSFVAAKSQAHCSAASSNCRRAHCWHACMSASTQQ